MAVNPPAIRDEYIPSENLELNVTSLLDPLPA